MRFRSLATLGVALAFTGAAACTDTTNPNGTLAGGLYALASVNGTPLPYSYSNQNTGGTTTLQSDVYTISGDGTYSETINETIANGYGTTPTTDNESGTWSQNGNTITFQPVSSTFVNPPYNAYTGTVASGGALGTDVLVFNNTGIGQMVYQHE